MSLHGPYGGTRKKKEKYPAPADVEGSKFRNSYQKEGKTFIQIMWAMSTKPKWLIFIWGVFPKALGNKSALIFEGIQRDLDNTRRNLNSTQLLFQPG